MLKLLSLRFRQAKLEKLLIYFHWPIIEPYLQCLSILIQKKNASGSLCNQVEPLMQHIQWMCVKMAKWPGLLDEHIRRNEFPAAHLHTPFKLILPSANSNGPPNVVRFRANLHTAIYVRESSVYEYICIFRTFRWPKGMYLPTSRKAIRTTCMMQNQREPLFA